MKKIDLIALDLDGTALNPQNQVSPATADAVRRARKARKFLAENGYTIRHSAMVWCQGCTDGDLHTLKAVYKLDTDRVIHEFMTDAGLETCFLIQIGNQRDEPELYVPIQQAQEELEGQSGQEEEFTVPDFDGYGYDYGG